MGQVFTMTTSHTPIQPSPNGQHFERLSRSHTLRLHRTLGPHAPHRRSRAWLVDVAAAFVWAAIALAIWLGWRPG